MSHLCKSTQEQGRVAGGGGGRSHSGCPESCLLSGWLVNPLVERLVQCSDSAPAAHAGGTSIADEPYGSDTGSRGERVTAAAAAGQNAAAGSEWRRWAHVETGGAASTFTCGPRAGRPVSTQPSCVVDCCVVLDSGIKQPCKQPTWGPAWEQQALSRSRLGQAPAWQTNCQPTLGRAHVSTPLDPGC